MAAKNAVDLDGDVPQNRIAGHVVDENGQPIPRAYVSAVLSGGNIVFEVIADSGGHFDFLAVNPGEYAVRATSPDAHFKSGRSGVSVRSGTMDVRLVLTGAAITGRVLYDGKPMPHFGVSLHQRDIAFTGGRMAIRDAGGRSTLGHLEPGTWQLTLAGPGTRMKRLDQITIESGRRVDVGDIVLELDPLP